MAALAEMTTQGVAVAIPEVVSPAANGNQVDAVGRRTGQAIAQDIFQRHMSALEARRDSDLIREKLLLHIDGSGDFQWADIHNGARVEIPNYISEYRKTENILRLLVDNAVSYHTTMPLRFFADSSPDRRARDKALVDTLWANNLAYVQDFNGLFAEALYMAMPCGFGIVHGYWRDDVDNDWFEPVGYGAGGDPMAEMMKMFNPGQGMIDCWVGNSFDTVFDIGAKRNSVLWCSYGRVLPADLVRQHFGHVPGVDGLEGTTKLPSASEFHRIARSWTSYSLGMHGSPVMNSRRQKTEELMTVICREIAPGGSPDYPDGRLQIIAVPGDVDTMRGRGHGAHALLLADQPLPGQAFSWELFYSHHRGSDIHGKPWVEDLDQLQVDLNIAKSKRWEVTNKMAEAPIVAPGGAIADDLLDIGGYNLLEVEPSMGAWRPRPMEWPQSIIQALDNEIRELRQALYTGGGYQAASRGEAPGSRMAYRAIVALQEADKSIHGPVNQRFRRSAVNFMRKCWFQMKAYGDVPWLVKSVGDEYQYLAETYIDNTKMSDVPPSYRLVNAFGTTPELHAQELQQLVTTRGSDGQPLLRTDEFRRQYPNQLVFDEAGNPAGVQRRRAKTVATALHKIAVAFRRETGLEEEDPSHPWVQQAARWVFDEVERRYPRLRDDDLNAHLAAYSEITQDETADPVARLAAMARQNLYYEWQAQIATQNASQMAAPQQMQRLGPGTTPSTERRDVVVEAQRGGTGGATLADVG